MQIEIMPYLVYRKEEILPLYAAVGWTNYTARPEMLEAAYRNSLCVLGAYDGDRLVGVIRVVGDGASIVFVQDLLVLPAYQRQGVGTKLLQVILKRYADVYQLELLTDDTPKTAAFYQSLGLARADILGCCAFVRMQSKAAGSVRQSMDIPQDDRREK